MKSIVLIGVGNVGTHLGRALFNAGHHILQVFSRKWNNAQKLASNLNAQATTDFAEITNTADIYLLAVKDDAVKNVATQLAHCQGILAHTSGSLGLEVFPEIATNTGYFYPLQTFKKNLAIDIKQTPIFVNAKQQADTEILKNLADSISNRVAEITNDDKQKLHVSAVILNNFVNHLFALIYEFLENHQLDFTYLRPIIQTTIGRVLKENPALLQTGPALRGDNGTEQRHLELLADYNLLKEVYQTLSENIKQFHNSKNKHGK